MELRIASVIYVPAVRLRKGEILGGDEDRIFKLQYATVC